MSLATSCFIVQMMYKEIMKFVSFVLVEQVSHESCVSSWMYETDDDDNNNNIYSVFARLKASSNTYIYLLNFFHSSYFLILTSP